MPPLNIKNSPVNLILACDKNFGIGKNNDLPWAGKLKNEMKYFAATTKNVPPMYVNKAQNAVIMGRKTWESLPVKFRPLKGRLNVVLSNSLTLSDAEKNSEKFSQNNFQITNDLQTILQELKQDEKIFKIWIIGGASLYNTCMKQDLCDEIYLTNVMEDFDCDVKICNPSDSGFERDPDHRAVGNDILEEDGLKYRYEVWNKL